IVPALLLTLCLAGCNRSSQSRDAVRQGIVDHLQARQFNMATMDLDLTSVQFKGAHADATVSVYAKGTSAAQGMSMKYQLEQQGGKWVVVGRNDAGGAPHGGAVATPGGAMPGAGSPPRGGGRGGPPARSAPGADEGAGRRDPSPPPPRRNEACRDPERRRRCGART